MHEDRLLAHLPSRWSVRLRWRRARPGGPVLVAFVLLLVPGLARPQADSTPADAAQDTATTRGVIASMARRVAWIVPRLHAYYDSLGQRGVYPWLGGQGPNSGLGPDVLFGSRDADSGIAWFHVRGGYTTKRYWLVETRLGVDGTGPAGPLGVEAFASVARRSQDEFFGLGNRSDPGGRSNYERKRRTGGGVLSAGVGATVTAKVDLAWTETSTAAGLDDDLPGVDSLFGPTEAPLVGATVRYLSLGGSLAWSPAPRYSFQRRGFWAHAQYRWYHSLTDGAADFGTLRANAGAEARLDAGGAASVAAALYVEAVTPSNTGVVPFYELPPLGGPTTLPSFYWERFRDRELLLGKVELRHRIWREARDAAWVDLVLFVNQGMVANRLRDEFAFSALHASYGAGVSVITATLSVCMASLAHGDEGLRFNLTFGPQF